MADPAVVAALLLARCELMKTQGPTLPVAFPDVAFKPPASGQYLRVDHFPNAPFWEGLKSGRIDQGLLQIMVVWPRGKGIIKPSQVAAQVIAHFAKTTTLYGSGVKVKVQREPWMSEPIVSDDKTETPITIPWVAS